MWSLASSCRSCTSCPFCLRKPRRIISVGLIMIKDLFRYDKIDALPSRGRTSTVTVVLNDDLPPRHLPAPRDKLPEQNIKRLPLRIRMQQNARLEARRPQNWEALQALESVSPPSPSPSFGTDFMESLCSVGEIPIILDSGLLQASDSDASLFQPAVRATFPAISSSTATLETIGTFGPTRDPVSDNSLNGERFDFYRDSVDSLSASMAYTTPSRRGSLLSPRNGSGGYYDRPPGELSSFTISAYLSPSMQQIQDPSPASVRRTPTRYSPAQSPDASARSRRFGRDGNAHASSTATSLSTMRFNVSSSSASSATVTDRSTKVPKHPPPSYRWARSPDAHNTRLAGSPSPVPRSLTPTMHTNNSRIASPTRLSPSSPSSIYHLRPLSRTRSSSTINSIDSGRSSHSGKSARSDRSATSGRSLLHSKMLSGGEHAISQVPDALSWMTGIVLELWIDQEGFRLIRPAFKLAGYTTDADPFGPSSTSITNSLAQGNAHFHPVKGEGYLFHHAALDPLPVLRKLTMAEDDTRDYISRQAYLAIKTNGTYSVRGSEAFDIGSLNPHAPTGSAHPAAHASPRLTWRFEYQVEDAVRSKAGEKLLTPLSFSCSPGLLHPTHGKKIRVMQVVKKNFTPKLVSAIVASSPHVGQQQQLSVPLSPLHPSVPVLLNQEPAPNTVHGTETRVARLMHVAHRRAHSTTDDAPGLDDASLREVSDGVRSGVNKCRATSVVGTGTAPPPGIALHVPVQSRSAVNASPESDVDAPTRIDTAATGAPAGTTSSSRPLARHIVPPSELAHMLDASAPSPARTKSAVRLRTSLPPPPPHRVTLRSHDLAGKAWK